MKTLWEQIWEAQDKKCAECGNDTKLTRTAKSSYSLKIVCQECHWGGETTVILDELTPFC